MHNTVLQLQIMCILQQKPSVHRNILNVCIHPKTSFQVATFFNNQIKTHTKYRNISFLSVCKPLYNTSKFFS